MTRFLIKMQQECEHTVEAENVEQAVQQALAATHTPLSSWEVRSIEILSDLPEGLTPESAFYAMDGPVEQRRRDLIRILNLVYGWDTQAANTLRQETREYLEQVDPPRNLPDGLKQK